MRTLIALLCLLAAALPALGSKASKLYQEGRRAEQNGQIAKAYILYAEAAALEPENQMYWARSQALRTRAAIEAKVLPKSSALPSGGLEDESPPAQFDSPTARDLAEARKPLPPTSLKANAGKQDFDLQGDARQVYDKVAKAFGLDCVFDGDFQAGKSFRFRMGQADYRDALHALEASTGTFVVTLSPKLFLVAKDSQQKRNEVEPYVTIVVDLPEPTNNTDLTSLITAVQQTMAIQKVSFDTQKNIVVMRDSVSKVLTARDLFEDLLHPRAQVAVEMQFIEVSHKKSTAYGMDLPSSFTISTLAQNATRTLANLARFGTGQTVIGVAVATANAVATLTDSASKVLLHTEVRSVDGMPATIHVGDRYPIMTSGYFGPASFSGPGSYSPPPSFNFEDLGMALKVTPKVHGMEEISMELEAEFKVLSGAGVNGIPIISNRQFKTNIRLNNSEWAVVAGLMTTSEARTISGIAGLSSIRGLGALVRKDTRDHSATEVLVLIRPKLITLPPDQVVTHTFRIGSDTRPLTPL